jgi:hypothetical protein
MAYNADMPQEQVFSEQEAADILRRAAELMEKTSTAEEGGGYTPGITREELERIANEVGVDPKFLLLAIAEAAEGESKKGPLHLTEEFERVIEGELDPAHYDVLAENIKTFGNAGQPAMAQIGRSLQASAWTGISQAKVNVTSRNGRTRLSVKSTPLIALLAGGYPTLMGAIISAATLSEAGYVGWGIAAAAGIVGLGIGAVNWLLKRGHRASRKLADKLKLAIAQETMAKAPQANLDEKLEARVGNS